MIGLKVPRWHIVLKSYVGLKSFWVSSAPGKSSVSGVLSVSGVSSVPAKVLIFIFFSLGIVQILCCHFMTIVDSSQYDNC